MHSFLEAIRNLPDFYGMSGVPNEEISIAEETLGVKFSKDYKIYLQNIGVMSANGHEVTGICNSKRLNVVHVTEEERKNHPQAQKEWYVIEQANIDGIVVWQNSIGEIYQTGPRVNCIKISNSLLDYMKGC